MTSPFKSYDVRGIYPEDIDESLAYKLGRAIVMQCKAKTVVLGRDCRESSPALAKSLIYGMTDQGADVLDAGLISTPISYFASREHVAVMVTASHNPPEYNGVKVTGKGVVKIGFGSGLEMVEHAVVENAFPEVKRKGSAKSVDMLSAYVKHVKAVFKKDIAGWKGTQRVLFDTGNGMGGLVVPELMKGLPIDYDILYKDPNGSFPNHIPNPIKATNTRELQQRVVKGKYDMGVAYDADCDRVFFIDERGERVTSSRALAVLAQNLAPKRVVRTVSASRIIDDVIEAVGGKVFVSKVGHVHVAKMMKEQDCMLGVEVSGHFFFRDFFFAESGDMAVMCMLAALYRAKQPLSVLVEPFVKYADSEEVNLNVQDQDAALRSIEDAFADAKIAKIDGVSVDAGDFWFNLRKSNTEPVLRLNAEALDDAALKKGVQKVRDILA